MLSGSFVPFATKSWIDLTLVLGRGHLDRILRRATRSTTTPNAPIEVWIYGLQPEGPSGRSHPPRHALAVSISSVA